MYRYMCNPVMKVFTLMTIISVVKPLLSVPIIVPKQQLWFAYSKFIHPPTVVN